MIDSRRDAAPWTSGRCLVYARCSTDAQDASIPDQMETIERDRKQWRLELAHEPFIDDGLKGHDETRPALRAIMAHVRAHPIPVRRNADFIPILVYDVSRFGRFDDPKKVFAYFVEVERYGYEFYSVTERIRSRGNISDFVQLIIKGEQAYDYSVTLSKYAMRTALQLAQKGWWPGGTAPYGYDRMTYGPDGKPKYRYVTMHDKSVRKYTPEGTLVETLQPTTDKGKVRSAYSDKLRGDRVRLVPGDPERVKIVQEIFAEFASGKRGLKSIARELNARCIVPPRGRCWIPLSIRNFLRNDAYRGALVYGRRSDGKHHWLDIEKTADGYATHIERKDVPGRVFVHRTIEECIVVEDGHTAIVSKGLWNKTQERLEAQRVTKGHADTQSGPSVHSAYLLSGDKLMKCADCGYSFQGRTDPRTKRRYYYDSGYDRGGTSVCKCTYVPAEQVEQWILGRIGSRLFGSKPPTSAALRHLEDAIVRQLEAECAKGRRTEEARETERRLAEKRAKVKLLVSELDAETLALVKEELHGLKREIDLLEERLAALRAKGASDAADDPRLRARRIVSQVLDMMRVLANGTPQEQKEFIRGFVGAITVHADTGRVDVEFFGPASDEGNSYGWVWCPQGAMDQRGTRLPVALPPSCPLAWRSASVTSA